jgi:hypothetical protein
MKTPSIETMNLLAATAVGQSPPTDGEASARDGDPSEPPLPGPNQRKLALELHRAELEAIPEEELAGINVNVTDAAMLVLRVSTRWEPYQARIAALSTEVNRAQISKIVGFALATLQANSLLLTVTAPDNELYAALQKATEMRDRLADEAQGLVRRGLLPSKSLGNIAREAGYRNVALELSALTNLLQENFSKLVGKTPITAQELDEANVLADEIFYNAKERELRHPKIVAARKLRSQAYTAMVRAYEEMQRILAFLAPTQLELLAPSLSPGRGRGSNAELQEEPPVAPPTASTSTQNGAVSTGTAPTGGVPSGGAGGPSVSIGPDLPNPFRE